MGVGIGGYSDRGVTKRSRNGLEVRAARQEQRCERMAEIMKPDLRQLCVARDPRERQPERVWVPRQAVALVRTAPGHTQIGADLVAPISGEWKSIEMLDSRMRKIEKTQASIDTSLKVLLALAGAIAAAFIIYLLKSDIEVRTTSARSAAPGPAVSTPHVRRVPALKR